MQWILNGTKLHIFSQSRHLELTSQQTAASTASTQTAAEFSQRLRGIGCQWCCQMQLLCSADAKIWHQLSKLTCPSAQRRAGIARHIRTQKCPFLRGDLDFHLIHSSLGPPESTSKMDLDRFSHFAGLTIVTDRQTDRQCYSLCSNPVSAAMQRKNDWYFTVYQCNAVNTLDCICHILFQHAIYRYSYSLTLHYVMRQSCLQCFDSVGWGRAGRASGL